MKLVLSAVLLIVLSSCGSTDYFEDAIQCENDNMIPLINKDGIVEVTDGEATMVPEKGACVEEWDKYNRAERRKDERAEYERRMQCPRGQIFICRDRWCASRTTNREPTRTDTIRSGCAILNRF